MSATLTVKATIEHGEYAQDFIRVAMDSTYPAGGEVLDATGDIGYFEAIFKPSTNGYIAKWDVANQKLKVLYDDNNNAADGPLIENATTDLSAEVFEGVAWRLK